MPPDPNKYPTDTDRRRFVRGVVGGAALAGLSTSAAASIDTLTTPGGVGGGSTTYFGAETVGGPAPRALPQIPVELDDEGYLRGIWPRSIDEEAAVAEMEIGGETYRSSWFQYCGVQTSPAVRPDAERDDYLRYTGGNRYDWQVEETESGDRIHVDDFADYERWHNGLGTAGIGKPAAATWRSRGLEPANTLPVQVIRSPLVETRAENSEWLAATTDRGFLAVLNKCTHFCCVPGFKHSGQAETQPGGTPDEIYCQCHQSFYDPFSIVKREFTALPRPE